ncbi:MAG: Cysteine--tRNA ligase [Actinobacteria bacterium]|nr:Cysteine--tRNA ligase [Actinomycetota bacterium]MCW3043104.1 Cysteine--tRNA ligase [Actinomycetota bacterium]
MRIYNTLTHDTDPLPPAPGPIRMYFCGPTVYRRVHIGNARPFVISAWLRRWLRETGYDVTLVENITDVNDKIYEAAPGHSAELAARAAAWYIEDTDRLGLGRPDFEPRATETVGQQIALIEELFGRGLAYEAEGDVYFRVGKFPEYGRLSGQRPDQVQEQEPNARKEDPRDFALWKGHKPGEDTWWDSPWGRGRPGWHIECSAMAEMFLGPVFEIHGGGLDLIFPHHENELAQSRGAGREFAKIWMHNGMLEMGGADMHKSLGNDVSLHAALNAWGPETLLLFFMGAHWHSSIDFSDSALESARAQAGRFREAFGGPGVAAPEGEWEQLVAVLDDDFNTAEALALLHKWRSAGYLDLLRRALAVFGLESLTLQREAPPDVVALAERRQAARVAKDFAQSDRLRAEIDEAGWEVRDTAGAFRLVPRE